jgi:hypothetical protein
MDAAPLNFVRFPEAGDPVVVTVPLPPPFAAAVMRPWGSIVRFALV